MKAGFMRHITSLVRQSDLVIEVLDARYVERTRNFNLENMIKTQGKRLLIVLNKSDLVDNKKILEEKKKELEQIINAKVIFISALEKDGMNMIRREMGNSANKNGVTVGIIGYPNVGKSTLINSLAGRGRGRVPTSRKAGLTRGITKVKITEDVYLIDSPGIIPFQQDEFDLFLVDSKNPNQLKEVENVAVKLIQLLGVEKVAKFYQISEKDSRGKDEEDILEEIAKKRAMLQKGGKGDSAKAAREVLERYQKHELK